MPTNLLNFVFWALIATQAALASEPPAQRAASQPAAAPATQPAGPATSAPASQPATDDEAAPSDDLSQFWKPGQPLPLLANFHELAPGRAWRSGQLPPEMLRDVVARHGIRVVVNLRGENPQAEWYRQQRDLCRELGVELIDIRLSASAWPQRAELLKLFDVLKSERRPMLLHCKAGADRTGLASAMYKMLVEERPREEAALQLSILFGHIRSATPIMDAFIERFEPRRQWIEREYQPGD